MSIHCSHRVIAPFLLSAFIIGCSKPPADNKEAGKPLPVTVMAAQPQNLPIVLELVAQTEGAKETEVRAQVGGILVKRLYEEGALVKAGQPLFQIDRAPYENALADAKAKAEQTAREAARLKGLIAHQAVSQKEYDDAMSADAMAQASLRQAQLNLSWTTVTAPVNGVSGRANKSEGNLISVGDAVPLTSVYQSNPMWVRFGLAESDIAKLPGNVFNPAIVRRIELVLPTGQIYPKPGKLNFVASNIDTTLGTLQVRAEFDNAQGQLLPGQFVRARLAIGERPGVFLVPQSAIVQTDKGRLVMVVGADSKVMPKPIETAEWQGKNWVVTKGLQAGDQIIVDNLIKIKPGIPVAPHGPQPETAPQAVSGQNPAKKS
jgi:membrane fusion protein (multidrug efflux system)